MVQSLLLLFPLLFPLGLDTLGVSLSLGMKSVKTQPGASGRWLPFWLRSALLFAGTEMIMPLVGLALGYELSWMMSLIMRPVGAVLLIGVGGWELFGEIQEIREKQRKKNAPMTTRPAAGKQGTRFLPVGVIPDWLKSLLLAFSISIDELIVGFSLGNITASIAESKGISTFAICAFIGIQAAIMTVVGIFLGRWLHTSIRMLKQLSEWMAGLSLIGLGVWLLFFAG